MDTKQLIEDPRKEVEPIDNREDIPPPPYSTGEAPGTSPPLQQQYGQPGHPYGQPGPQYDQPGAQYDQPGAQQGPQYGQPGPQYDQPGAQYGQPGVQQGPLNGQTVVQQVPQYVHQKGQGYGQQVQAMDPPPAYPVTNQTVITTQPTQTVILQNSPPPPDHLVWSIVTTLFCCLCLGIPAIVMSIQSRNYAHDGDMGNARQKSNTARTLNAVGLAIGISSYVAVLVLRFVVGLEYNLNHY
ncbi:unnamed protein product [Owenia fusiformis]|uniref:Uncharacterized protein n=1 Tax=Owenia fusiformis TaxID=6347 RepID=A0A8J1TCR3_OWEFU|nr:unnamed protein product [Owenia fusiformis]